MLAGCACPANSQPTDYRTDTSPRIDWQRVEFSDRLVAGRSTTVSVTLRNDGNAVWPDDQLADPIKLEGAGAVRLSHRWWSANGERLVIDYAGRTTLPFPVAPAESLTLLLDVMSPPQPGKYRLQLDLVRELLVWFETQGARTYVIPVEVSLR